MNNTFSIGAVLGTGFRIWFKNLLPFLLITTVVFIPLIVWGITITNGEQSREQLENFNSYHGLVVLLLNTFAAAAITYGTVMELQGQHAGIGACFATGLSRFFPVLGVALLSTLFMVLGILALIIPGIIIFCMLYVSTPAAVLERPGIMGALKRSRELTDGHKFAIFGLLFLVGVINFGLTYIAQELIVKNGMAESVMEFGDIQALTRKYIYVQLVLNIIIGSLGAVMQAVTYYYLRNEKEGTTANELAQVFE